MLIYLAGLQSVPEHLYEAAALDGAGPLARFRHVTLPMLTPTLFFNLVMAIIGSFQVFTSAYVMTEGGPNEATLFYVLYLYQKAFEQFEMGYASAMAWILFAIVLALTLLVLRSAKSVGLLRRGTAGMTTEARITGRRPWVRRLGALIESAASRSPVVPVTRGATDRYLRPACARHRAVHHAFPVCARRLAEEAGWGLCLPALALSGRPAVVQLQDARSRAAVRAVPLE